MTGTASHADVSAAVDQALALVRAVSGADRCSLSVWRSYGGTDLWSLDESGPEFRHLPIVSPQLLDHFNRHPVAERRRDLAESAFRSDNSLHGKGYAEVIRAPLADSTGKVFGVLNLIRKKPGERDRDVAFAGAMGQALALVVAEEQPGNGPQ
ncbi:MAG: GAF domain-containing protein [Dehalococcoidia bacterium]